MDTNASFSIRHAELTDAAGIADVYNEAILHTTATFDTEPKSVDDRKEWLQSHDDRHPVLVAVLDGRVVGWASLTYWSDRPAYDDTAETSFYVHSSCRGRGIGRKLKEAIIEEARRLRYHTLIARWPRGAKRAFISTRRQVLSTSARSKKSDASSAGSWTCTSCRRCSIDHGGGVVQLRHSALQLMCVCLWSVSSSADLICVHLRNLRITIVSHVPCGYLRRVPSPTGGRVASG